MKARIKRIVFEADVHRNKNVKRLGFQIPAPVVNLLGVGRHGPIALVIRTLNGRRRYAGTREMSSRYEVYGTDMGIKWGDTILVEVAPPATQ
jgi:hypothetical protein